MSTNAPSDFAPTLSREHRARLIRAHERKLFSTNAGPLAVDLASRLLCLPQEVEPLLTDFGIHETRERLRATMHSTLTRALLASSRRVDDRVFSDPERTSVVLIRALGGARRRALHIFDYDDQRTRRGKGG